MNAASAPDRVPVLKPRFRIMVGATIALGPGKAALLQLVDETGSLNAAASRMKMSYMRAWSLVREMNGCFASPLVLSRRGGAKGGGARLSPLGKKVLGLYLELGRAAARADAPVWRKLRGCLAKDTATVGK
jgi:molybdate transport system regulatory protein